MSSAPRGQQKVRMVLTKRGIHCKVILVTFLGTEFHENFENFHDLAGVTAESGVSRTFEWYTTLCI